MNGMFYTALCGALGRVVIGVSIGGALLYLLGLAGAWYMTGGRQWIEAFLYSIVS